MGSWKLPLRFCSAPQKAVKLRVKLRVQRRPLKFLGYGISAEERQAVHEAIQREAMKGVTGNAVKARLPKPFIVHITPQLVLGGKHRTKKYNV